MKRTTMKATALAISAAVLLGLGSSPVFAKNTKTAAAAPAVTASAAASCAKDETVYVLSGPDGSRQQVIVSDWLQNTNQAAVLRDVSSLSGIQNVKGMETYTAGKDGALLWQADGADIYYQGTSDQTLPVDLKISYTLDGKAVTPEQLAGQSGNVTIRFDYHNNTSKNVKIGGKTESLPIPFLMISGVMLDTAHFRNVTVKNGKAENLGNQIAVVGFALPGMQEALQLDRKALELPDYLEITADAEDFRLETTMTIATTAPFRELGTKKLENMDLKDQAATLTGGVQQLLDGSGQLYDGLNTLLEQSGALVDGVDQLAAGSVKLQAGVDALSGGASQLQSGASSLASGLSTLDSNSGALNDGARQVFNSLLSMAQEQISAAGLDIPSLTIDNYADVLGQVIGSLDENAVYQAALEQVTAAVNARRGEVEAAVTPVVRQKVEAEVRIQVTAGVREKVTAAVEEQEGKIRALVIFKSTGLTPKLYEAAVEAGLISEEKQQAIEEAIAAAKAAEVEKQMGSKKIQATIDSITAEKTDEQMQTPEIQAVIAENVDIQIEKLIAEAMASEEVQQKLEAAAEGAQAIIGLKASLDSYNSFYLGLLTYTGGVSTAAAGAEQLSGGIDTLKSGADALKDGAEALGGGISAMQNKTPALVDGVTALRDGAGAMKDGLNKLMAEGIQKIADLAEEDLDRLSGRLTAAVEAARDYDSFSGLNADAEGTVKFIYKTSSVVRSGR